MFFGHSVVQIEEDLQEINFI